MRLRFLCFVALLTPVPMNDAGAARTDAAGACNKGDVDCDSVITMADILHVVNYVFCSGPPPCGSLCGFPSPARETAMVPQTAATPGQWDTLALDRVTVCDTSSPVGIGLFVKNHDSLLTLIIPLRVSSLCGPGFVRFDSVVWIDRLADTTVLDEVFWTALDVDGVSPDWIYIRAWDYGFEGAPPLDAGEGYLCRIYFTPIGGEAEIELSMRNSYGADQFMYVARQFATEVIDGRLSVTPIAGTGDLNFDLRITAADIILLVGMILKTGQ